MGDIQTIAGTWRLLSADYASVPTSHYMEFVFSVEGENVRGAIQRRNADGQSSGATGLRSGAGTALAARHRV